MRTVSDRRLKVIVFVLAFAVYAAVGYWLQVRHGFILGDALSRASAAQSVLFSRDPHLAAIGFIFTPLTAMAQIPMIALSPVWPDFAERAFSGSLMSAAFMAGAVVQILSTGSDRGLSRRYVLVITAIFALNPMIVFYGSNGMSEAPFVFFVTWAVRRLMMWMVDDDVHHLIAAGGIAMGLAYLTRYDAVACVAAAALLVGVTTYRRARIPPRFRRALLDVLLVSGPGLAALVGWAVASWLITGEAFTQFTSQYGNTAILRQSGGGTSDFGAGLVFSVASMTLLAPTLIPLVVWAGFMRWRRPNWGMLLAPIVIFGATLAFQALTYATGETFPFLRFYIVAIPFAACMALVAVPDGGFAVPKRRGRYAPKSAQTPTTRSLRGGYLAAAAFAVSVPVAGWGMSLPMYAPQEFALAAVLDPDPDSVSPAKADQRRVAATFSTERQLARYLDRLQLPESSIIADTMYGFAVIVASDRPKTFVVPSDADFVRLLNDPSGRGVRYLLAVPNTGRGVADALNLRYPTLYETGSDVATLELEIPNQGENQPTYRLYRVNEPLPQK
ncbi:ArnT family glycosyltransferase [Mycolicibacterium baixiangningiae]|uniref:ArnT family glycosyltransferase n=1 Tax=Mycolicibacterium baixiangningiae TaxID=2761578 RepID=UPI00186934E4|nr:ABC transporter [Mycolicibacterium baixiangningiae]